MPKATRSIRLRLIAGAAILIAAALSVAGFALEALFERHVERRIVEDLQSDLKQLLSSFDLGADGAIGPIRPLYDPRFQQPFSGLYWQIARSGTVIARSRSLWDEQLPMPDDELSVGGTHVHTLDGPAGQKLIVVERKVLLPSANGTLVRVSAGRDAGEIRSAIAAFRSDIIEALTILGLLLLLAFAIAISVGLRPLQDLRAALSRLRRGDAPRLSGSFPAELEPLVEDLNALLESREASLARARARAADLAHGLKTPIAAISVIAQELGSAGDEKIAKELASYASTMTAHLERELARARIADAQLAARHMPVAGIVDRLIATMRRLPRGCDLSWETAVPPEIRVRADEMALTEAIGNVLDNARKWARSEVFVSARQAGAGVVITISDDGPGIPEDDRNTAIARGKRLDEATPGTGLGLAIARDSIEEMNGSFALSESRGGGLAVEITLPASPLGGPRSA